MHYSLPKRAVSLALAALTVFTMTAVAGAQSVSELFNEAELTPKSPGSDALNTYLDELIPELTDEEDKPFKQLLDCYDYLVKNLRYGSHTRNLDATINGVSCRSIYRKYGEVEGFGGVALSAKVGMCNAYAAAFIMMARKLGYNAYLVRGSTKAAGGGYAYHEWAEIELDGAVYLFDPQLEQNLDAAGLGDHVVFAKTYDQLPGRYIKK